MISRRVYCETTKTAPARRALMRKRTRLRQRMKGGKNCGWVSGRMFSRYGREPCGTRVRRGPSTAIVRTAQRPGGMIRRKPALTVAPIIAGLSQALVDGARDEELLAVQGGAEHVDIRRAQPLHR